MRRVTVEAITRRASSPITLIGLAMVGAGVAHWVGWPKVDTLTAGLVAGGLFVVLAGAPLTRWAQRRLSSVKVAGVFEFALHAPATEAADEGESAPATDVRALIDQIENRMRRAADWTSIPTRTRSRRQLLDVLSGSGYIERVDAAALRALFDEPGRAASEEDIAALRAIAKRLRTEILTREAELCFEKQGLVPQRPRAPRDAVGYRFSVAAPSSTTIHVDILIGLATGSKLAAPRSEQLRAIPGASQRWLVTQQPIDAPDVVAGVQVISVDRLRRAIEDVMRAPAGMEEPMPKES